MQGESSVLYCLQQPLKMVQKRMLISYSRIIKLLREKTLFRLGQIGTDNSLYDPLDRTFFILFKS